MIITRRFNLLKHWCTNQSARERVGFFELLKHLLAPISKYKAKAFINQIREEKDYYIIHFRSLVRPLYVPKSFGTSQIFQVISEIFREDDWHYYEIPETKIKTDDIVVDCGAAEGLFSLNISGRCKKVYAIEPLPDFVWALETYGATRGVMHTHCLRCSKNTVKMMWQ
jgi:hypothetical protein